MDAKKLQYDPNMEYNKPYAKIYESREDNLYS